MHTGVISFCDRIAFNIKSSDAKDIILDDLHTKFGIKILQRHWFPLDERNKDHIHRSPHSLMLRSNGNPYYLYFTKYEDVSQMMFIDKKVHPNYEKPRIILIRGQFDECLFENTLMDGEMVKDDRNQWIFLINDVIGYRNRLLENETLPIRLGRAFELFQKMYHPDPLMDVCQFHVKKLFPAIQSQWEALMAFHESLPYTNRGVYIWPHSLKYKPKLMNFDDSVIKKVIRKVKDDPMFREAGDAGKAHVVREASQAHAVREAGDAGKAHVVREASQAHAVREAGDAGKAREAYAVREAGEASEAHTEMIEESAVAPAQETQAIPQNNETNTQKRLLYLRKTENPDVYYVFEDETTKHRLSTAFIPSLSLSKQIRAIFKDLNVITPIRFQCMYEPKFDKWMPIQKDP